MVGAALQQKVCSGPGGRTLERMGCRFGRAGSGEGRGGEKSCMEKGCGCKADLGMMAGGGVGMDRGGAAANLPIDRHVAEGNRM